jgi:SulP family sulfate permease
VAVETGMPVATADRADDAGGERKPYDSGIATDHDIVVYRISGAFFFGAAASVGAALEDIGVSPKAYVIDFAAVSVIDSTAASAIGAFVRKAQGQNAKVFISSARPAVQRILTGHDIHPPSTVFAPTLDAALIAARSG